MNAPITAPTPIVCLGCGQRGAVNRVTASLTCSCGSTDVDLDVGQQVRIAAPHGPGTGWGVSQDLTRGWSSYQGPLPGHNPISTPPVSDAMVCQSCMGSGVDLHDNAVCRGCGGSGLITPNTSRPEVESYDHVNGPPVGGARWASTRQAGRPAATPELSPQYQNRHGYPGFGERGMAGSGRAEFDPDNADSFYPNADTKSRYTRVRQDRDYDAPARPVALNEAPCPLCGHAPTGLKAVSLPGRDGGAQTHALWDCLNCGPLVDVDTHPHVDPYHPTETGWSPTLRPRVGRRRLFARQQPALLPGKLFAVMATISAVNDLPYPQVFTLARKTLLAYPEG